MTINTDKRREATMGVTVSEGDTDAGKSYAKIVFPGCRINGGKGAIRGLADWLPTH